MCVFFLDSMCVFFIIYLFIFNRRRGLDWFYKREARGRVNKYFLEQLEGTERCILLWQFVRSNAVTASSVF